MSAPTATTVSYWHLLYIFLSDVYVSESPTNEYPQANIGMDIV
jgi:hypothetical protein